MDPIIKEVELDVETESSSMVVQAYNPPPLCAHVCMIKVELVRTR